MKVGMRKQNGNVWVKSGATSFCDGKRIDKGLYSNINKYSCFVLESIFFGI